jgi:asparagine synthase (glutamine-hydrolysing)
MAVRRIGAAERSSIYDYADGEPYIRLRSIDGSWVRDGVAACALGHRIQRPGRDDDGVFAGWTWDGTTLRAHNDRFGFFPLYYFEHGAEIAISTSVLRLLALGAPTQLDYPALAVYLRFASFLGADTAFRAIRALPPNASFEWRHGRLRVTDGMRLVEPRRLAREDALDAYVAAFRAAMRRRSPPAEDFAVPLSGGRDSRHILLELCEAGYRPRFCATARYFPPGDTAEGEIEIAARVAGALGVTHVVVDQPPTQGEAERRCNAQTDFSTGDAAWMLALADHIKGKARYIYDGIGGDVLSAGLFLTARRLELLKTGDLRALAEDLFDAEYAAQIFTPSVRTALTRDVATARLIQEFERHLDAASPLSSFIFWNRTRRKIAVHSYRILARAGEVFAPYIDHDVFDLLSSLPAEMFLDHGFHTEAVAKAFPRYAGIPYSTREGRETAASHHPAVRRSAMELIVDGARHGRSSLVQRRYFLPRLVRCMVNREYSASITWLGPLMRYLIHLDEAARQASSVSSASPRPDPQHDPVTPLTPTCEPQERTSAAAPEPGVAAAGRVIGEARARGGDKRAH